MASIHASGSKRPALRALLGAAAVALALAGCGGGDGDGGGDAPGPGPGGGGDGATGSVPGSAVASVSAFTGFIRALVASETAEPLGIDGGFTAPTDDAAEPLPLG